jgi:CRISPR/Cas system-associated protein endoribonuclease Cas2
MACGVRPNKGDIRSLVVLKKLFTSIEVNFHEMALDEKVSPFPFPL